MFRLLFVLFIVIPIVEIAVIMQVGALLGVWPTIIIVILTAWLGAKYVREQGISTLQSVQTKTAQGEMPSDEIVTGLMLLIAGVFLVTPGFVTDFFGLSLLIPQVRQAIVTAVKSQISTNMSSTSYYSYTHQSFESPNDLKRTPSSNKSPHQGQTLEGEFERKE